MNAEDKAWTELAKVMRWKARLTMFQDCPNDFLEAQRVIAEEQNVVLEYAEACVAKALADPLALLERLARFNFSEGCGFGDCLLPGKLNLRVRAWPEDNFTYHIGDKEWGSIRAKVAALLAKHRP